MGLTSPKTIVCAIGTRPEAIKMAPVIQAFQETPRARCRVLLTGQHRELVDEALTFFGVEPHIDLDVMRLKLPIDRLASHLVRALSSTLASERPDMVPAQGDTTSVVATAIASIHRNLPFGHVEAGLRTQRLFAPFPEEANRVCISVAHWLTAMARPPHGSSRSWASTWVSLLGRSRGGRSDQSVESARWAECPFAEFAAIVWMIRRIRRLARSAGPRRGCDSIL